MVTRVVLFLCIVVAARAGEFITPICIKLDKPLKVTSQGIPRIVTEGKILSEINVLNFNLIDGDLSYCSVPTLRNFIFHMVPRLKQKQFAMNTWINDTSVCIKACSKAWGKEEDTHGMPLSVGMPFEIIIACETNYYQIYANGEHVASYEHRIPLNKATYFVIAGDATFSRVEVIYPPDSYNSSPTEACQINQIDIN